MARITYGGIATSIRGSIGGSTFQGNAFGFSIKNKPNMARLQSQLQNFQRQLMDMVIRSWGQLTDAQRSAWNAFAIAHPVYSANNPSAQLTGYLWYIKYNLIYALSYNSTVAAPNEGTPVVPILHPYMAKTSTSL